MKKSLLALATLTAFAGAASAQSSVTLFGIADVAVRNVKNGSAGSLNTVSSGGAATSRFGVRGIEDMGGGLKAGFWLESEVAPDTGAAGSTVGTATGVFWARRSTVSLMGNFGEVRLGRDYTANWQNWNAIEIFGHTGVATPGNIRTAFYGNSIVNTALRNSNTVAYFLPAMGGLYGQVQVGLDEKAANQNKSSAFRFGYAADPANVGVSWQRMNRVLTMVDNMTTWNVIGSFDAGFAKFAAGYEKSTYGNRNQKLATVNATIPFGAGLFKAQYTKGSGNGNLTTTVTAATDQSKLYDASLISLGYNYNLSKRTFLFTNYGRVSNGGGGTNGGAYTASASGPAVGALRGFTSTGVEFGINHSF